MSMNCMEYGTRLAKMTQKCKYQYPSRQPTLINITDSYPASCHHVGFNMTTTGFF
jgi:hypothetical protein